MEAKPRFDDVRRQGKAGKIDLGQDFGTASEVGSTGKGAPTPLVCVSQDGRGGLVL
jgi:hypothetical protein